MRSLLVDGRVLVDHYHGIGRLTEMLLRAVAADGGWRTTVVVGPSQSSRRFDLDALVEGLGSHRAFLTAGLDDPLQALRWPRVLREVGADVALFPYNLGAALSGPGRRVAFVHDCVLETDARYAPGARTRALYRVHTAAVVRRTAVLTRSGASAREIERFYRVPMADWQVVPGGVEPGFGSLADPQGRLEAPGLDRVPARYLLQVGARRPHKNVAVLVRALAHLPREVVLVLVGTVDGRFADDVPAAAAEAGVAERVVHLPSVSEADLHTLYAHAEAYCYPSLVEGLGQPLLEAMTAGTPVVASDVPVFREVAGGADGGVAAAELVPPLSPRAWAQGVLRATAPRRRAELVAAGRVRAAGSTWALTGERLLAALDRVAAGGA